MTRLCFDIFGISGVLVCVCVALCVWCVCVCRVVCVCVCVCGVCVCVVLNDRLLAIDRLCSRESVTMSLFFLRQLPRAARMHN